jgi:hypothetical protein
VTCDPYSLIGTTYADSVLTEALVDDKLVPALRALDEIDPDRGFGLRSRKSALALVNYTPEVFGSTDLAWSALVIERLFWIGSLVMALPSKSEENYQLLFYAAAAMRTAATSSIFHTRAKEIELIIVQPPYVKRWVTDARVDSVRE